jgi:catechol 2,3-dioxygenase-like lactoylglutathione lyase family enzyme
MFEKVAVISIPVKDQQAAKAFYTDMLGCTIVQERPFGTPDTMWINWFSPPGSRPWRPAACTVSSWQRTASTRLMRT